MKSRFSIFIFALALFGIVLAIVTQADAQGIYMGRDGRAHAQVIVGADGTPFPVAPTFCTPGFGPCPVILGAPFGPPVAYDPPPVAYAPPFVASDPPPPIGWVYTRFTVCPEPSSCPVVFVSVSVDGLNVRPAGPDSPPIMALANGTPLFVLDRRGAWTLVAAACPLAPMPAFSVTAGVPLSACVQ